MKVLSFAQVEVSEPTKMLQGVSTKVRTVSVEISEIDVVGYCSVKDTRVINEAVTIVDQTSLVGEVEKVSTSFVRPEIVY